MAKFIEEKDIITSRVNDYIEKINDFSKYISGSPTFTTYYHKDELASTHDIGLKGVYEIVGTESPIRFNKINDFPMYNMQNMGVETDTDEEEGTNTDIEGEAIILPDCGIVPLVDDCFVINYDKRKLTFRVIDVQISSIADKVLYKISFIFTKWDLSLLEENQLVKEYETRFDNIGNQNINGNVLIERSIHIQIEKLVELRSRLKEEYIKYFYNKDLNTFLYYERGNYVYDNFLMYFINKNSLFIEKKTFLKNIYIEPLYSFKMEDHHEYSDSIFYNIELEEYRSFSDVPEFLEYKKVNHKYSPFEVYKMKYPNIYEIKHYKNSISSTVLELDYIVRRYLLYLKSIKSNSDIANLDSEIKDLTEDILNYKLMAAREKEYLNVPIIIVIINKLIKRLEVLNK